MITGYKNVNPILVAEPFQASQGDEVPTSPKDLQDYYDDMEKRDLERKQSRGKSRRWTLRGSNKGGDKGNDKKVLEHGEPNRKQSSLSEQVSEHHGGQAQITGRHTPPLADHPYDASNESRSSVSELRMDDLVPSPWSYEPPEHVTSRIAPPSTYRTYYKIHNPVGPRFYRNHHLRPLNHSTFAAASRPASAFSSAFPPLAALPPGSPPPRGLGLGRAQLHPHNNPPQFPSPHTSFSSSESVLPTPESSENAFPGPGGETSRKNNNDVVNGTVVADPVDQLDGSNPYGQRFHHDSPYDLGKKGKGNEQGPRNGTLVAGASSVTDLKPPRSRMSVQLPRKTTPSPLSQSTSAINIQPVTSWVTRSQPAPCRSATRKSHLISFFSRHSQRVKVEHQAQPSFRPCSPHTKALQVLQAN
ncbi:hypothetical protein JB92DRAFT_1424008 [Gautieria morchelliformis]|nr:hypothetical protein JB92DRAFT_1424008 [Gautieria morchelliformis]